MKRPCVSLVLLGILLIPYNGHSQNDLRPVTSKYAITNATIIPSPGKTIKKGTLVIENGVIRTIGSKAKVPSDAQIIDADSMFIYAGFIGGISNIGIPKNKDERPKDDPKTKQAPTYKRAGITPNTSAVEVINSKDASIGDFRKLGFTASGIAPRNGMISGKTGLFLLAGKSAEDMVVRRDQTLFSQLEGARGVYPNTVIGVMAKYRELFNQANQSRAYSGQYSSSNTGMERYSNDLTIEGLFDAASGKIPVTFKAQEILDIMRVLTLQKELGFKVVLADIKQGWDATSEIKAANPNVFLSLNLPKDPDDKSKKEKKSEDEKGSENEEEKEEEKEVDPEKEALEKRKSEQRNKHYALSSTFKKSGIKFGYSLLDLKSGDFRKSMKKIIDNGLSENDALAALTTIPAEILGVSSLMGTLENGKMANIIITDKPYFEDKSTVRYVFIDGEKFEYKADEKKDVKTKTKKSDD